MPINDEVFAKLGELGYVGSLPDRVLSKLKDDYGVSDISEGLYKAGGLRGFVRGLLDVSYVARLDGVNQYWQASTPITASNLSFTFISDGVSGNPEDSAMGILSLNNSTAYIVLLPTGVIEVDSSISSLTFDGDTISDGADVTTYLDGRKISVVVNFSSPTQFNVMGRGRYVIQFLEGILYNVNVDNGLLVLPMNDPTQGATQNPTAGSISMNMINYNEDVWEGAN